MAPPFIKLNMMTGWQVRPPCRTRADALVRDPANINWLTGNDAWSFYTPQMMLVDMHDVHGMG